MGRADFIVSGCNALALKQLEDWRSWPNAKLALVGDEGAGKTHLARVFAAMAGADVLSAGEISPDALPIEAGALVIEDADCIRQANAASIEESIFHIHNALSARSAPLLFTGRTPPAKWPIKLPDLASRLRAVPVARIEPPDDALLLALLHKLFRDRQIGVADDVPEYLLNRMERSFAAAERIVDSLDAAALRAGRDMTRAFVVSTLKDAEAGL